MVFTRSIVRRALDEMDLPSGVLSHSELNGLPDRLWSDFGMNVRGELVEVRGLPTEVSYREDSWRDLGSLPDAACMLLFEEGGDVVGVRFDRIRELLHFLSITEQVPFAVLSLDGMWAAGVNDHDFCVRMQRPVD